jgi:hypothetical protein
VSRPQYLNPLQWNEAIGFARQNCARVFSNGGNPADALKCYGLSAHASDVGSDWSRAVDLIAQSMCTNMKRAA